MTDDHLKKIKSPPCLSTGTHGHNFPSKEGKHLLISWLQSPSAVVLEPRKIKSAIVSTVSPSICHEVMGPDAMILFF